MIDFSSRTAIESSLFIKWEIPNFETALICDYNTPLIIGGDTYTSIGNLLSVGNVVSELKASNSQLSISLSGIPVDSVSQILAKEIKGSNIQIIRGYFEPTNHATISAILKFKGIVTNYDISDTIDVGTLTATTTITLTCASMVEVLGKKISGRRTNPMDFPNETSMSRVQALANSNYNFGAPK